MNSSCSSINLEELKNLTEYQIQFLRMSKSKKDLLNVDTSRTKFMVLKQQWDYTSLTEKMLKALLASCKSSNLTTPRVDGSKNNDSLSPIENYTEYSLKISNFEDKRKNATLLLNKEELSYYEDILVNEIPEYKFMESYNLTRKDLEHLADSMYYKMAFIYDVVVYINDKLSDADEREYQAYLELEKLKEKLNKKKQKQES